MTSLKDVAELAGVSPSTVSYYLNGKKKVKPETEQRILDAVKKLHYRPNLVARSLKMRTTKSVGVLVSDLSNIFFLDIYAGIESVLAEHGYTCIISNSRDDKNIEKQSLRDLRNRNIDGVILLGTGKNNTEELDESGIPVVCVDRINSTDRYTVSVDNQLGGYIGMKYLLQKKRRHVIFIGFPQRISFAERYEGCRDAAREQGLDPDKTVTYVETEISLESGYQVVMDLFADGRLNASDAIFAGADSIAYGVLTALKDLSIGVPDQIGVIGFDDLLLSRFTSPTLTTIAQPRYEMGQCAGNMILDLVENKASERSEVFKPTLIIRESI